MTLTKTQIFHRTESLSGEIKAAREAQSECRKALADQERLTHIAAQAVERADARVAELEAERAELAEQARVAILGVGEPPLADVSAERPWLHDFDCTMNQMGGPGLCTCSGQGIQAGSFNSIFTEGVDFQAAALANGEAKLNQAFDEATR